MSRALFVASVAALVAVSCSSGAPEPEAAAGPATTVPPIDAPVPLPDTRGVELAGVAGTVPPLPPIEVRGGEADVVGTISGPDGPIADAVVLLDRFVDDRRASLIVRADNDGRFRALQVYGGRYRIRAWRTPDLALTFPELRFVRNEGETTVDLDLTTHSGLTVQAVVSASSPLVDETVTVTALVTSQVVDDRGIVVAPAAAGETVSLSASGGWSIDGQADRTVTADGRARWSVTCTTAGSGRLEVRTGDATTAIATSCQTPAETPDTPTVDPAPNPDFPIGNRFSPPFAPALPAGSYEVVDNPGSCGISYERYVNGAWEGTRRTATGTAGFEVATPFRDVRVIGDSPPCLYERVA